MQTIKIRYFILILISFVMFGAINSLSAKTSSNKIKSEIEAVLSSYYPDEFDINVNPAGNVTIRGTVNTLYDKLNIYDLISRVKGVTGIDDFLEINTPVLPDDVIKANIEESIKNNSVILEPDNIKVHVSEGLVILTGTVSYQKEKQMAESIAAWDDGVKGIDNQIHVLPVKIEKSDKNILSVLNEILKDDFPLMANKVNIQVKNGNVTVTGMANNLWEKNNLPKVFYKVLGVKSVVENLTINPQE